jgi:ketosteroid isomerase-like protein
MLSWLAGVLLRWTYRQVNTGNVDAVMKLVADDCQFTFPGNNRWGRTYRGKAEVEGFIRDLVDLGLQFEVHDTIAKGFPWNMTIVVVISDHATEPDGTIAYANRAVEVWKSRWGKIVSGELFEDTEKATAWDKRLSSKVVA